MQPSTDIVADGWVARLPSGLRPYALLARLDRPVGSWLLFLPGLWSILAAGPSLRAGLHLIALFAAGSVTMRSAGCVVNDMWDRDLDRQVRRTAGRPLASGALRMRHAMLLLAALLLLGLLILLQLNPAARALGAASLVLVAFYPLAKRFTWWPQLVMGFTFGFGGLLGYVAVTGRIDARALAVYAAAIAWDLGFDTIYGFQDMEDDAVIGVKSTSRRFAGTPRLFVGASYTACVLLLALAGWLGQFAPWFWLALPVPAALLAYQVAALDIHDPRACLRQFRLNRETGLAVAAAMLLGSL